MTKKEVYERKVKAQLDEWEAEIEFIKAKTRKAGAEAQANYLDAIEKLENKQAHAKSELKRLQDAGDDAWEDLKDGIQGAWDSLGEAIESAKKRFK